MKAVRVVLAAMGPLLSGFASGAGTDPASDSPHAALVFYDLDPAFLIYLETAEVPASEVQHYLDGLNQCLRLLRNQDRPGARQMLKNLATNPKLDKGLCDELDHRIDATLAILGQKDAVQNTDHDLQSSLHKSDQAPDDVADALRKQSEAARDKDSPSDPASSDSSLSSHLTENYLKDAQTREDISANDQTYLLLVDQCRRDYVNYIVGLETDGYDRQVPVAAASYNLLFPGLDDPKIQKAVVRCRDQTASIDKMIAGVQEAGSRRRLVAALQQLMVSYRDGPHDPRLLAVPVALKKQVLAFIFEQQKLRLAIQARDPDICEQLLPEMTRQSSDFDGRPIQDWAETIRKKSELLVAQAKSAMEKDQTSAVLEDFQAASAIWPGNPNLQGNAVELVLRQESKTESLQKFDGYLIQGDYNFLTAHAQDFGPWIDGDNRRQEELTQARGKVQIADRAIEQAAILQADNHGAQAWETLEFASRAWPANRRLNELKLVIAPSAADFVHALTQADEAEKRNDLGLSLSWYAVARSYAAQSRLAQEGIDRTAGKILR